MKNYYVRIVLILLSQSFLNIMKFPVTADTFYAYNLVFGKMVKI